jgi:hypothetical protein
VTSLVWNDLTFPLLALVLGWWLGILTESWRKTHDLRLDAANGVTFIKGEPHVLRPYQYDASGHYAPPA